MFDISAPTLIESLGTNVLFKNRLKFLGVEIVGLEISYSLNYLRIARLSQDCQAISGLPCNLRIARFSGLPSNLRIARFSGLPSYLRIIKLSWDYQALSGLPSSLSYLGIVKFSQNQVISGLPRIVKLS